MRKSYEQNRALLKQKKSFARMKDYYRQTYSDERDATPDFAGLEKWHVQRAKARRRERFYVAIIYGLLAIGVVALYYLI